MCKYQTLFDSRKLFCRALFVVALCCSSALFFCHCAKAQTAWRVPEGKTEWNRTGNALLQLYRAERYTEVIENTSVIAPILLRANVEEYLPTICVALAMSKAGWAFESLGFFEKALRLRFKSDNLLTYAETVRDVKNSERGLKFLSALNAAPFDAAEQKAFERAQQELWFFHLIDAGDLQYLSGDKKAALTFYQQARKYLRDVPNDALEQSRFIARQKHTWDEYTYRHLYDVPDGYKRLSWEVESFLKSKIALCEDETSARETVPFRVAAVVIRRTDLEFENEGKQQQERNHLDERELSLYRNAWRFAGDAAHLYSGRKVQIKTDWIDLKDAVLRGLDERTWKDLIRVRHLDVTKIAPSQAKLFEKLAAEYDGVVFVWDRGQAGRAFGGGPIKMPGENGDLPSRAGIKNLPLSPANALHEWMHNLNKVIKNGPVHGPKQPQQTFAEHEIEDEIDWYVYLLKSVQDWKNAKFVAP